MSTQNAATSHATAALAAFAAGLEFEDIPDPVIAKAKLCLLDTVGCCVYGSALGPVQKLLQMVVAEGARPLSTVLGTSHRIAPAQAALVNGTSAHAFQIDEVHAGATLHPGSVVIPAALALAEAAGDVSGREFLVAMLAGYEVGIRVGRATGGRMFKRGYHNQGTTGPIAAAVAASRVLKLDAHATMHAMGLAASQAAGLMAVQEGANAKAFHSGRASQSGVYAALLAKAGFTGVENVLDITYGGFYSTFVDAHEPDKLTQDLGRRWETLEVGFKASPASNGSITAMHTLQRIMRKHRLSADEITKICASVSTNTLEHCGWHFDPAGSKGVLAAQMNLRYGLAAMGLDGEANPAQYSDSRISRTDIAAFLQKISVRVNDAYDKDPALRLACTLEVQSRTGETYVDETLYRPGGIEDPMSVSEIDRKFMGLASEVIAPQRASECMAHIKNLENESRVRILAE